MKWVNVRERTEWNPMKQRENERWELGERTHGASQANRGPFLLSHFFYLLLTLSHTNTVSGERWERSEEEERERGEQREVNKVNQMNVACASLHSLTHCSFISSLYYVLFVHSLNYYEGNTMGTEESKVVPIGLVPFTLLLVWENEESKQWEQNGWEFPLFVLPYYYLRKWTNSRERSLFIVPLV